jgi:hypothetical protein
MTKSRTMSRKRPKSRTPLLPTLPVEIKFRAKPFFKWEVTEEENDWLFQCSWPYSNEYNARTPIPAQLLRLKGKEYTGSKYVEHLLDIETPEELAVFMNINGCPFDEVVEYPVEEEYHRKKVPFYWSDFQRFQMNLKGAMDVPVSKLLLRPEFKWAFNLTGFQLKVDRDDGAYYGRVWTRASVPLCYRVIAVNRLLGEVKYGFCERCGKPFQVESRHKRKYCPLPAPCGHAVAQEKYRMRQQKSEMRRTPN